MVKPGARRARPRSFRKYPERRGRFLVSRQKFFRNGGLIRNTAAMCDCECRCHEADKRGKRPQLVRRMQTNLNKLTERLLGTKAEVYKLGVDVHARDVVVCVQMDGALPQRAQRMSAAELVGLTQRLVTAGRRVFVCQESGPCGYTLHRQLEAVGATSYVIVPTPLADGRRQKTDGLDAAALADKLDRYLRGNRKACTPIRVPSVEEEQRRAEVRLREQLKHSRHQWEARGRSLLLCHGHHVGGAWWTQRAWAALSPTLTPWLVEALEVMRTVLLQLDRQEKARRDALEQTAPNNLPKAIGALTWVMLAREICQWAASKTVARSPATPACAPACTKAVAAARRLAVDLWRLATGQTTPEKLHLIVPAGVIG